MSHRVRQPEPAFDPSDIRSTLQGTGLVLAIRVSAACIGYLSLVLLARWMGATELGIYTYAFAWLALFSIPAGLGLPTACVRFLPQYLEAESRSIGLFLRQHCEHATERELRHAPPS